MYSFPNTNLKDQIIAEASVFLNSLLVIVDVIMNCCWSI